MESLASRLTNGTLRARPSSPVPIALVITDLDVGGAERALLALTLKLDPSRWKPSVTCLGPEGALVEPLRRAGLDVACLNGDRRRPFAVVNRLARRLRAVRPSLVQSFLFHANLATRLAAPWAGRPWVVGGLRVAERRAVWHLSLDRWTVGLATGSVCVSKGVERFARQEGQLPADRLTVIPNGIDVKTLDHALPVDRRTLGLADGHHLALFVGRIEAQKGIGPLLEAAEIVAEARTDWFLLMVGDGPDRARWEAVTHKSPQLQNRVRWLGRRSDVPGLLKAADIVVLPSLWEGMPNVVLEGMAARRAVVATAVEGSEDLVIPGLTGWLVPPGEPKPLAAALREAAADPDRLLRYGQAGRVRVEADFNAEQVVLAYDRLWSQILGYRD